MAMDALFGASLLGVQQQARQNQLSQLGGLGQAGGTFFRDCFMTTTDTISTDVIERVKTFHEELQAEVTEWLPDL